MQTLVRITALCALFGASLVAQSVTPPPNNAAIAVISAPSGACTVNQAQVVGPGGTIYTCQSGTWAQVAGTGGGGPTVQVNGSSTGLTSTANFNGTTPAAGSGLVNVTFQASGSSISAEVSAIPSGVCALGSVTGTVTLNDSSCSGSLTGNLPWAYVTMTLTANTTLAAPTFTNGFHQISATENGTGGYTLTYNAAFGNPLAMVTAAGTVNWYSFYWTGSVSALTSGGNTSGYSQLSTIADPTCTAPTNTAWAWISSLTGLPKYCNVAGTISQPIIQDGTSAGANQTSAACNANFVMKGMGNDANPDCKQLAFSNLSGSVTGAQLPAFTGDTTTSAGSTVTTTSKVNGVSYGTSPGTNTVAVVTGTNATTYEAVPHAAIAATAVTPGSYTSTNLTVAADGSITAASNGSGGSGGGLSGWSNPSPASFTVNATQYAPFSGGGSTSATESTVDSGMPATATLSKLYVYLNAAFGAGASATITLRDNTVSQVLTCTISAGGTNCSDTTHSFAPAAGDLVDWQIATSGTVTNASPQIMVNYASGTSGVGITGCASGLTAVAGNCQISANGVGNAQLTAVQVRRTCVIDNDTQSATPLVAANFSGRCVIPAAATIVEVDLVGGTGTITGTATAPTVTGTSSVQLGKYTPNGGTSTTGLLSGALAMVSGVVCALSSTSGTCINGNTSSGTISISTTALAAGDVLYLSAATADGTQTWANATVIYTIN